MTITNVLQVGDHYTADVDGKTMTFPIDPTTIPVEMLEQMQAQAEEIRLSNLPEYIQELAKLDLTGDAQEICDTLNAPHIPLYTPVPVDTMITALITIGAYVKLRDAETDKTDPSHAMAINLLALLSPSVKTLDFSLPAAGMLMDSFVATGLATTAEIEYVKALGVRMINWSESIGYSGSITISDIERARG